MSLEDDFRSAQERVMKLATRPGNDTLLELYALFKQGTAGDVSGKRPGLLDLKGRAKYDAWAARKGLGRDDAQRLYVELVNRLSGSPR
jgi:diazepam-binding inhibitor (GABA receptor modulating acyl-CoA-binding protein)